MKRLLTARVTALILSLCLIIAASPFLTACGPKEKPKAETLTVRDITLDTTEAKTEFAYGEQFTAEGLKVTATLSDDSTRDIPLSSCRISKVNSAPGKRKVSVTYARKTKRYEVVFLEKPMPPISETSLLDIEGEEVYRIQAEAIDLAISGTAATGGELKLTGGNADNGGYIGNYGVAENYFGFTFTADKDYANTTAVLRVANPSTENSLYFGGDMTVHLNYKGVNDNGSLGIMNSAAIVKSGEGELSWCDFILRGLNIKEGANTLTFSILGENVPYIDYVDFYIGSEFSKSTVTLADVGEKVVQDFENLSIEKVVTRNDYMEAYNLSTGEVCVLPNAQADGGNAVYALMSGQATTLITAEQDSTVQIIINAASHIDWRFTRDAEIKLDGEVITFNEQNIRAGTETEVVWKETSFGFFDLTAGEHLLDIKISSPHAKFDSVTFKTVSEGEFTDHPEIYLDTVGTQIMEGEHLDSTNVVVRQDYSELIIGATHGKYNTRTEQTASGWKYIDGFTGFPDANKNPYGNEVEKTEFTFDFYLAGNATVEVNAVACSALGVNFANRGQVLVKIDGEICSPAPCNLAQYWNGSDYDGDRWLDTQIARKNLEAGKHTFTMEVLNFFFDLDCFKFTALTMGGYEPDADISSSGTYYIEAEKLDPGGVIARQDFLDAGRISSPTGEYCVEAANTPHGGYNICGMATGSRLNAGFTLEDQASVRIYIGAKSNLGIAVWKTDHCKFYIDDKLLSPKVQNVMNANNNSWIELEIAEYTYLEAGNHTFTISIEDFSYELDYIKIEVGNYGEDEDNPREIKFTDNGEKTFEAEWIDDCNVVIENGFSATDGYKYHIATDMNPSNGMYVNGLKTGSWFRLHFSVEQSAAVKILANIKAGIPVEIWKQHHCKIYMDGELISPPADQGGLTSAFTEKILFEGNLTAGDHVLKIEMDPFGFDMDYFKYVVTNFGTAQ